MNNYCIVKGNKRLSQFIPNDLTRNQLCFRRGDWYTFGTIEEAKEFINHIQGTASMRTKPSTLQLRVGMNL